jgi:hypothetical protein
MPPKAATGNELLALRIQEYIRFYTPRSFREPIHVFDFTPMISSEQAGQILNLYHTGTLNKDSLTTFKNLAKRWYFIEAVLDFFKEGKADA